MTKQYDIEKITDIFAIPEDKFDEFLVDLKAYYQFGKSLPPLLEGLAKVGGVDTTVAPQGMTWIDDGKHNANVKLTTAKE